MPPRKEPKETVVYPASKRKPPPFKPLRPSKAPKSTATQASSSSTRTQQPAKRPVAKAARRTTLPDSDEEGDDDDNDDEAEDDALNQFNRSKSSTTHHSDSDDLPSLPATSKFSTANGRPASSKPFPPPPSKRKSIREPSPLSASSQEATPPAQPQDSSPLSPGAEKPSDATDALATADTVPPIPGPLLVRLLYEKFHDKSTQIDKSALELVQKYLEIFVREAIARTALEKRDEASRGVVGELDGKWLELEDLEKIAPGLLMDF